jgi:hypothetical protein
MRVMTEKDVAQIIELAHELAHAYASDLATRSDYSRAELAKAKAAVRAALDPFVAPTTVTAQRGACPGCGKLYGHTIGCPFDPL